MRNDAPNPHVVLKNAQSRLERLVQKASEARSLKNKVAILRDAQEIVNGMVKLGTATLRHEAMQEGKHAMLVPSIKIDDARGMTKANQRVKIVRVTSRNWQVEYLHDDELLTLWVKPEMLEPILASER
jgi:hypothetical protein